MYPEVQSLGSKVQFPRHRQTLVLDLIIIIIFLNLLDGEVVSKSWIRLNLLSRKPVLKEPAN